MLPGDEHSHRLKRLRCGYYARMSPRRPHVLEQAVQRLSRASLLDGFANLVTGAASRVFRPGPAKDAISGTGVGHPNHPWLTDLPIGFWTSAAFLDLFGGKASRAAARRMVGAGILSAVPTAITGLSDLSDVENKEHRRIGMTHAFANSAALVCYVLSYRSRARGKRGRLWSTLGLGALTGAGYLGGHLSYRLGIGVDHTAFQTKIQEWTPALPDSELTEGQPVRANVGDNEIMLVRLHGRIYALANRCSHRGGPLFKGEIQDLCVVCPWHQSTFSLEDGSIVRGPASAPQPSYDVRVVDGMVEVRSNGHPAVSNFAGEAANAPAATGR